MDHNMKTKSEKKTDTRAKDTYELTKHNNNNRQKTTP